MIDTIRGNGYSQIQTAQTGKSAYESQAQNTQQSASGDYWSDYTQDRVDISSSLYGPNPFTDDKYSNQYSQVFSPDFPQDQLDPNSVDSFDYDNQQDANDEYDKRSNLKYVHDNGYSIARFSDYSQMSPDDIASINNGVCNDKGLIDKYNQQTAGFQQTYGYEGMKPEDIAKKETELAGQQGAGVVK